MARSLEMAATALDGGVPLRARQRESKKEKAVWAAAPRAQVRGSAGAMGRGNGIYPSIHGACFKLRWLH
jgi:hypothetical protein